MREYACPETHRREGRGNALEAEQAQHVDVEGRGAGGEHDGGGERDEDIHRVAPRERDGAQREHQQRELEAKHDSKRYLRAVLHRLAQHGLERHEEDVDADGGAHRRLEARVVNQRVRRAAQPRHRSHLRGGAAAAALHLLAAQAEGGGPVAEVRLVARLAAFQRHRDAHVSVHERGGDEVAPQQHREDDPGDEEDGGRRVALHERPHDRGPGVERGDGEERQRGVSHVVKMQQRRESRAQARHAGRVDKHARARRRRVIAIAAHDAQPVVIEAEQLARARQDLLHGDTRVSP